MLMIILIIASLDYLFLLNNLFLYIVLILVIFEIINIIVTIVYNIDKNKTFRIISTVLNCVNIFIFLIVSILLIRVNLLFNNMSIKDDTVNQKGYISYNINIHDYKDYDELKDKELKIGVIKDDNSDFYGKGAFKDLNLDNIVYFDNDFELFKALVDSNDLDIAIFDRFYRQAVKASSEIEYMNYLDNVKDIESFEVNAKKNKESLDSNTFNILLIGYSSDSEDSDIGLADGIMLASINLNTLQVDLTSISRSTDVTFACGGGVRGKINETILYDEDCLTNTVENLLDVHVDYYIKVNFHAVVDIVDAIDGIVVDNPVEFVGQTSSSNRGEYTVWVPGGDGVYLNGEQALAFSRERNSYENGDLQRQLNQQQVISRIIEKVLDKRYMGKLLNVVEAAGNNIKTNLSKYQMLDLVNRALSCKNYTGVTMFSKLAIYSLQVVGEYVESYDYYARLPIYVYKLYPKSLIECKDKINDVLQSDINNIVQGAYFSFTALEPFVEEGQIVDIYNDIDSLYEELPNYYPSFVGMDYALAISWAKVNNVDLTIEMISKGSSEYDPTKAGQITYQSIYQGQLVVENKECTIKVMQRADK